MMKKRLLTLMLAMAFSFTVLTVSAEVVDQEEITPCLLDCEGRGVTEENTPDQNNNASPIVISNLDEMLVFLNSENREPA